MEWCGGDGGKGRERVMEGGGRGSNGGDEGMGGVVEWCGGDEATFLRSSLTSCVSL